MRNSRVITLFSVVLLFSFALISCGDDPTSANEDPPVLPTFENIEPDLSYFESNQPQQSNSNYSEAYYYGVGLGSIAFTSQAYVSFFSLADSENADFKNGKWVWEYSYSYEGESVSIKLTAEPDGDFINWEMLWSFDDGQGNSITDYAIVTGRIASDGNSGSWTFNALNPDTNEEEPVLISEWSTSGENNLEIETDYYDSGSVVTTYTYTQNDNEFTVFLSDTDEENDLTVFWDDEAMTGYLQIGSDSSNRSCWDSNFEDVACASVGY